MQAKTDLLAGRVLACVLNGDMIAELGIASPTKLTPLWLSLHSDEPSSKGTQIDKELDYTGYERVAVKRDLLDLQWKIEGRTALNNSLLRFPKCTAGEGIAKWVGIGTEKRGGGVLLFRGKIKIPAGGMRITQNIRPEFEPRDITIIEN